jgi:Icc-related predicted phosphoesterase
MKNNEKKEKERKGEGTTIYKSDKAFLFVFFPPTPHTLSTFYDTSTKLGFNSLKNVMAKHKPQHTMVNKTQNHIAQS